MAANQVFFTAKWWFIEIEPLHGSVCFSKAALEKFNQPKVGGLVIVKRQQPEIEGWAECLQTPISTGFLSYCTFLFEFKKKKIECEILKLPSFLSCTEKDHSTAKHSRGHRVTGLGQKAAQTRPCTVLWSSLPDLIPDSVCTFMGSGVAHRAYTSAIFIQYAWLDEKHSCPRACGIAGSAKVELRNSFFYFLKKKQNKPKKTKPSPPPLKNPKLTCVNKWSRNVKRSRNTWRAALVLKVRS